MFKKIRKLFWRKKAFTTDGGTWVVPKAVTHVMVECVGGGGGVLPPKVDLRGLPPVRDQGGMGADTACALIGALEQKVKDDGVK